MFFWMFGRETIEGVLDALHQQLRYMEDLSNGELAIQEVLLL